jgi:DNA-binding Lrp family transcriptional regulator
VSVRESNTVDDMDRRIIKELQGNFPLEMNPYEVIADNLGMSVDQLWQRILALAESGVIRRMGFSIDSRKIGYSSTLAAVRVSQDRIDEASELISEYPQITHSYLREDDFNIWFTVIADDRDRVLVILGEIRDKLNLTEDDVMDLPVEKLFKLDARFK